MDEIVGRQVEIAQLEGVVGRARQGTGGSLVIVGEPGVGKTALLNATAARADGFRVLTITGVQTETDLPFAALSTLLGPVLSGIDELPEAQAVALSAALGLLPEPQVQRLACYAGVMTVLAQAARARPMLVVADDFQWLDLASQQALLFALRRLTSDAIAFLFAVRNDERTLAMLSGLPQLRLEGLSETAARTLLRATGRPVADSIAERLWSATAGNPLALTEGLWQLRDEQLAGRAPVDDPVPIGVRLEEAYAQRMQQLPPATRTAVTVASASYTSSAAAITNAMAVLGLPPTALEPAESAGLLRLGGDAVQWRHPLIRSAAYHHAPPPERRAAHRALAEAGGGLGLSEHRAWHLAACAVAPDEEVAAALEGVAAEAARRSALTTAAEALAKAASLTPDEADRARREVGAAEHAAAVGRWDMAEGLLDRAREHSSGLLLRAQAERIRARVEILRGTPAAAQNRLVTLADQLESTHPALAAEILTEAVVAHQATGDRRAYSAIADRALALGQKVGDPQEAVAGLVIASARVAHGETEEALDLYRRYGAAAGSPALWRSAPEIPCMYAYCQMSLENFGEAERLLAAMIDSARAAGTVRGLTYPLAQRALLDLRLGRLASAHSAAEEAVELARAMLEGAMLAYTLAVLARVEAVLGLLEPSREHAAESIDMSQPMGAQGIEAHALAASATLAVSIPDWDAVIRELERFGPSVIEWLREPGWMHTDADLIEAHVHAGHRRQAEELLERLERRAAATGRTWAHATSARCRGLLAPSGEFDAHFERAIEWHRRAPLPLERARTELLYGHKLRRSRRRADARIQLTNAAATFHGLGASVWAARAEQELAAAGYGIHSPADASPWGLLTAAETRVAQVIIQGATYQGAAERLFLSPRTVESHLRQIYRKLGVRSRAELSRALGRATVQRAS